jgi:GNAT superfamily N-acetyltransferase
MTMTDWEIEIRPCRRDEWEVLADHEYAMWRDIGAAPDQIRPDWRARTLRFVEDAAECRQFAAFAALAEGRIVGSACGQIWAGLSPDVLEPHYKCKGYIWGVYVAPPHRGQGIARALTAAVTAHLQSVGCTQIHLDASPAGRPVYEKLGFAPSNGMRLMVKNE